MQHLNGLDAAFLFLETPETPMHVGGLNLLELPPGYRGSFVQRLRRHCTQRLPLVPALQRKLLTMPLDLANPVWVNDEDLDLDYHIQSIKLPAPGSRAQLEQLVAQLHASPLERNRPLWQLHVIEGLAPAPDAPAGARQLACYVKLHHAAVDGAAAMALAHVLLDLSSQPRRLRQPTHHQTGAPTPGPLALGRAGLRHSALQALALAQRLPALARAGIELLRPAPASGQRLPTAQPPTHSAWFAPKTRLNDCIGSERSFASLSLPLAELKLLASQQAVTLNDVVLCLCAGALRSYLLSHGELPEQALQAAVPMSLRQDGNTDMNTQVSMIRISLASTVADPLERLHAIGQAGRRVKQAAGGMKQNMPTDFPSLGTPWLLRGAAALWGRAGLAGRVAPLANLVISNVPGPQVPLYLAGARVLSCYPVSIPVHGMALNITVQSYNGSLDFGLIACQRTVPDLALLAEQLQLACQELLQAVRPAPAPRRQARRRPTAAQRGAPAATPAPVAEVATRTKKKTIARKQAPKSAAG